MKRWFAALSGDSSVRAHARRAFAHAIVALALVCTSLAPSAAHAATAEELKAQLDQLKAATKAAGDAYDHAYWSLDEAEVRIDKTDKQLAKTAKEFDKASAALSERAANIYRRSDAGPVEFMMGATSFEGFVTRMEYLRRVNAADAKVVSDVKSLRRRLTAQRAALAKERATGERAVATLKARNERLQSELRAKQADFARVKAQLDAVRGGPNRPSGQMAYPGPNGMVFPVVGSYYYSDTWGASRGGGRRTHKGTDIMAPRGTPVVAVLSGTVSAKNGGLGGKTIWLTADNGWSFYFAHLDGWAVRSGRVKAGQVIGYVGNTGNAAGGACHLHFQIQPHGSPVNPYPYLRAME